MGLFIFCPCVINVVCIFQITDSLQIFNMNFFLPFCVLL
jgi:hypothetical protein